MKSSFTAFSKASSYLQEPKKPASDDGVSLCDLSKLSQDLIDHLRYKQCEHNELGFFTRLTSDYPGQKKIVDKILAAINNEDTKDEEKQQIVLDIIRQYCLSYGQGRISQTLASAYFELKRGTGIELRMRPKQDTNSNTPNGDEITTYSPH